VGVDRADDERARRGNLGGSKTRAAVDSGAGAQHGVRNSGLLRRARGSAALEIVFAMVVLVFLVLGVVQVGYTLYARNVVASSAHEGARAAVEHGRDVRSAALIAEQTIRRAAGGLVDDVDVAIRLLERDRATVVTVDVAGSLRRFGPVPWAATITARATASRSAP
jgi:Flp pilus assembly protein TadG